ncbi:MAG: hypothetical protein Fur0037_16330 [Planctomycetota bacterium]
MFQRGSVAMTGRPMLADRMRRVAAFLLPLAACACLSPRENSVHRAARERERSEWAYRGDRIQKEIEALRQFVEDKEQKVEELRDRAAMTASRTRDALAALRHELDLLKAAEEDLAAARGRLAEARKEVDPVLAEIEALKAKPAELARLRGEAASLDGQIEAARAELRQKQEAAQRHLAELRQKEQQVAAFDQAVQKALAGVRDAATPLVPEPAAAPQGGAAAPAQPGGAPPPQGKTPPPKKNAP